MDKSRSVNLASETPTMSLLQMVIPTSWTLPCIYTAAKLGIADLLKDGPKQIDELAVLTDTNESALCRVLRTLTSIGVFLEVNPKCFTLTPTAQLLRSDVPDSLHGLFIIFGGMVYRSFGELLYSVKTGKPAFDDIFNMSLYDYFRSNTSIGKSFNDAMASYSAQSASLIANSYDFSRIKSIVDIGGGIGVFLSAVLKENPHMKGILFDSPEVIEQAKDKEYLKKDISSGRCQLVSGSFFESVPSGAEAYIIKFALNDWKDDQVIKIITNCHKAMKKNGKLLIIEYIDSTDLCRNEHSDRAFPDMVTLVLTPGRMRTEREFSTLLQAAGFSQPKFINIPSTSMYIIESMRLDKVKELKEKSIDIVAKFMEEGKYQEVAQLAQAMDHKRWYEVGQIMGAVSEH